MLVITVESANASEVAFTFDGIVTLSSSSPFGFTIAPNGPLTGRFVYDTTAALSHPNAGCDCAGYRQQLFNGFSALFGEVEVRADDYIIEIANDLPQSGNRQADVFSVIFSSNADPPLEKPLTVGSSHQSTGLFRIAFLDYSSSLFSDSSLPEEFEFGDFNVRLGELNDMPTGEIDVFFLITSLSPFTVIAGDYDFDEDVDGADFLIWQRTLASSDYLAADGQRDGVINGQDLEPWQSHFGQPQMLLRNVASLPEPNTFAASLSLALAALGRARPARNRGR
jgi:hypothetical protein